MKEEKVEKILIASLKPSYYSKEYEKKCFKCKNVVYLIDDWTYKQNVKIICNFCAQGLEGEIVIEDKTIEILNEEFGVELSREELKLMAAKMMGLKVKYTKELEEKLEYASFLREVKKQYYVGG